MFLLSSPSIKQSSNLWKIERPSFPVQLLCIYSVTVLYGRVIISFMHKVFIMASQVIYEKAVRHHLPSAFVTSLERTDEFVIGAVLVRHHKHHWYHDNSLDFTSIPLQCLLSKSEQQGFSFQTKSAGETECKERSLNITFGLNRDVSNNLKKSRLSFL